MRYFESPIETKRITRNLCLKNQTSINWNLDAVQNAYCHKVANDTDSSKTRFDRGFKIAHLNIRSLSKHIDELRLYLDKQQFDIISLNETMLNLSVANHEIKINGYTILWGKTEIGMAGEF